MSSNTSDKGNAARQAGQGFGKLLASSGGMRMGAQHVSGGGVLIGYDKRELRIPWPDGRDGKLYLVAGARGTGKTVGLIAIQKAAIELGAAVITIDHKGDPALLSGASGAAATVGKEVTRWTQDGPSRYNPYAHGRSMEISDKLLAGEAPGTHPHYLRMVQRFLGHLVRVLREAEIEVSLARVMEHFGDAEFGELLASLPLTETNKAARKYHASITAKQWDGLTGSRDRLAIVAESEAGRWWEGGAGAINLWEATQKGEILHFVIDSDGIPLLSEMMGVALALDLNTLISRRNKVLFDGGELDDIFVVIDEYGALAGDLSSIADRGRSAKVTLILATQDLYSHTTAHEGLQASLTANYDALICLREQNPQSARLAAELSSEEEIITTSWDEKGHRRYSSEEVLRIRQSQLMRLPDYAAAVVVPSYGEKESARMGRLLSPSQIASLR